MQLPKHITNPDPNIYLGDNYVTLDFETTNKDKGSALQAENSLLLSCWKAPQIIGKSKWGNIYEQAELLEAIEQADFLVIQNAKFELQWLQRMGLDLTMTVVFDTMIAEKVLAGNRQWPLDLGSLAKKHGFGEKDPFVDICMNAGICPSEIPKSKLEQRCKKDVWQTEQIFLKQRELLAEQNCLSVLYTRCLLTPVLADIEFNGIQLDAQRVLEEYSDHFKRFSEIETEINLFTGGINPRSTKQKAEFIYDTLKFKEITDFKGKPKRTPAGEKALATDPLSKAGRLTDTNTILSLKATNKRQRKYIELQQEYNKLNAALTKNLDFFYGICKERQGRFQGAFNQTVTRTHRLSSSGRKVNLKTFGKDKSCQFQNLPRQFKRLFTAREEGWKIGEIDGAQLEFRVAGYLGNDDKILSDILAGTDVHRFTAETLTAAGEPTNRQDAKSRTFKPLYGGESGTPAEVAYFKAFKEKYSGIASTQQDWVFKVLQDKKLVTCTGLTFYWPNTTMSRSGYINNKEAICNYPVQMLATAEIIPIAVVYLWHKMKALQMQSYLVNTIHDSAISELHPDETELWTEIAVESFTTDVYNYLKEVYDIEFFVPLGAGVKIGDHWSEGEEVKYESTPPYELAQ